MTSDVIVSAPPRPPGSALAGIKHVIAVASGKGGVGKSTTAVNLAVALQQMGAKVGLLDADIYGPSIPKLLGSDSAPTQGPDNKINPPTVHGLKFMSMGLFGSGTPTVWRGPMASKAVSQFLGEVNWGELDYLIVDLPPGTGDIQITISQAARLSGAVIVMTPQMLAVEVAKKGLKMFQQVRVPILGIVENMSEFECPHCHEVSHIFSKEGGSKVAEEMGLPLLSSHPLDPVQVQEGDKGLPVVLSRPGSVAAERYNTLARNMAKELRQLLNGERKSALEVVSMEPNPKARMFKVIWSDNKQSVITFKELRFHCPCAVCVDEGTGQRKITREMVKEEVAPVQVKTVGNYALQVVWTDGHDSGFYSYDYLRKLLVSSPT